MKPDDLNRDATGFRLLLQVRLGNALTSEEMSLTIRLAEREVTIRSSKKDQPLSETKWITFGVHSFATEKEARAFGEQLRTNVQIAALCCHLGADAGRDETLGLFNEEFLRSKGLLAPHQRIAPEIHGVLVLPDDDNTLFIRMEAEGRVTSDPTQFLGALSELAAHPPSSESVDTLPVKILNLALMNSDRLAKIVLAFSAIEVLAQGEIWSTEQRNFIEKLAAEIEDKACEDGTREVAEALRRLSRLGLRQGVKRVLRRNDLDHLESEWDGLYDLRSDLFHGRKRLTKQEVGKLANDVVKLSCKIILALMKRNSIKVPSIANKHFGNI